MSATDQLLCSDLHGTAMRYAAERRNLDESIAELRQIAGGRDDVLAEAAGITAVSWYAWPSTQLWLPAMTVSRWTMTSWNVGRASGSSGGCGHARASVDRRVRLCACSRERGTPRNCLGSLLSRSQLQGVRTQSQKLRPTAFVCLMRLVLQLRWPWHMRGSRPHWGEKRLDQSH
jgi:hypothetical protein